MESICYYFTVYIWPNADTITNWYCFGQKEVLFRVENSTGTKGIKPTTPCSRLQLSYDYPNLVNFAGAVPVGVKLGKKTLNVT